MPKIKKPNKKRTPSSKKERRNGRKFWITWAVIVGVTAVIWTGVLILLTAVLREYESVQPKYCAEQVFREHFAFDDDDRGMPADAEKISRALDGAKMPEISGYEDENAVFERIAQTMSSGEVRYLEAISSDDNEKVYVVTVGETQIGTFSLVRGGEPTKLLGLFGWVPDKVSVTLEPTRGVSIYAPKKSVVTVNGVELGENERVGDEVVVENAEYFPEDDADARVMVNYYVEGLFLCPEVKVRAPGIDGEEYQTDYDDENEAYNAEYGYRLSLADEYNREIERKRKEREEEDARRAAEEERLRLEEEERIRKEKEEKQKISDGIKAIYGDFVTEANQKFCIYSHTAPAERAAMRSSVLKYFKSGTPIYSQISSYYDYASWFPTKIDFENVSVDGFEWIDEAHKTFRCRITMNTVMEGKTYTPDGYKIDRITETYDKIVSVNGAGKNPLIYEISNPVREQ